MKKINYILTLLILVMSVFSLTEASTSLSAEKSSFKIFINSIEQKFESPIAVINGSIYLPIREICDKLKIDLKWDNKSKSIYIDEKKADLHFFETPDYKYGFADENNNVVIEPIYSYAEEFSEKRALVCKNPNASGEFGFIDENGEEVIPCIYYNAESFRDGAAVVSLAENTDEGKYIYIDKEGNRLFDREFDAAWSFSEGYAVVLKEGRLFPRTKGSELPKWSYINKEGEYATELDFEDAGTFSNGYASVKNNGKWGIINRNFELVIPYKYDEIKIVENAVGEIYGRIGENWDKIKI